MDGHQPRREISKNSRSSEPQAKIAAEARATIAISDLAALREERCLTQSALARSIGVSQVSISPIEHQDALTLSALEEYVRRLGGDLLVTAVFPNATIEFAGAGAMPRKDKS
jgi:DNA-binding XRE family transcriptional regulator